jgi:hypothetical protein
VVGFAVGALEGANVSPLIVGAKVVGKSVGALVGSSVGVLVGASVGTAVGSVVGARVGSVVGAVDA